MKKDLLKKLCCPQDKEDLIVDIFKEDENEEVIEGILVCPSCRRYYPIIFSIPIMTPDEYRQTELEAPLMQKWGIESPQQGKQDFYLENYKGLLLN